VDWRKLTSWILDITYDVVVLRFGLDLGLKRGVAAHEIAKTGNVSIKIGAGNNFT
jgi:hypothetical protein